MTQKKLLSQKNNDNPLTRLVLEIYEDSEAIPDPDQRIESQLNMLKQLTELGLIGLKELDTILFAMRDQNKKPCDLDKYETTERSLRELASQADTVHHKEDNPLKHIILQRYIDHQQTIIEDADEMPHKIIEQQLADIAILSKAGLLNPKELDDILFAMRKQNGIPCEEGWYEDAERSLRQN